MLRRPYDRTKRLCSSTHQRRAHNFYLSVSLSLSLIHSLSSTPYTLPPLYLSTLRRALYPMAFAKRIAADLLRPLWCPAYCPTGSNNPIRFYESLVLHRLSGSFQYRLIAISHDPLPPPHQTHTHISLASRPPAFPSSGLFHSISRRLLRLYASVRCITYMIYTPTIILLLLCIRRCSHCDGYYIVIYNIL